MSDEGIPAVRRHAAVIVTSAIVLFVAILVLHGVGGMLAGRKRDAVMRAWAGSLGSFEEILESHPARETNETAFRIEELGAALGIDMAPERLEGHTRPTEAAERAYRKTRLAVGEYLKARFTSGGSHDASPPEAVVGFLHEHVATLAELKRVLEEGGHARWQRRLDKAFETPLQNVRGHVDLQRLFLADALIRAGAGDSAGALGAFEASWRLNAALRDEPSLISQEIALGVARMQLGALRHLEHLPSIWSERIHEHDYRESSLLALRYEGWLWMTMYDPTSYAIANAPAFRVISRVTGPYVTYCAADVSDTWRLLLIRFSEMPSICDSAPEEAGFGADLEVPSWNIVGGQWLSGLGNLTRRLARYELDRELTAKLFEIQAVREAEGGSWPASLPGIDLSSACPAEHWIHEVTPQGGMSLALSRKLDWGDLSGAVLATEHVVPPS